MALPGPASQSSTQDPLRITAYGPQSYAAMRGAQNSSTPSPKTSTGVPNDTSKWGGRYNAGHLKEQERKPSLPTKLSHDPQDRSEHSTINGQLPPRLGRKVSDGGYKLQPIAYSPNLQQQDDDRQSWDVGDDEDSMMSSPPGNPDSKPTKSLLPPKLPLLYFEQDRVEQIDFAYQHSRSASASQSRHDVNGTQEHDSNQIPNGGRDARASPRPSPSPIDTRVGRNHNDQTETNSADYGNSNEDEEDEDDVGARGGSFYWHSPGSTENGDESPRPFDGEDDEQEEETRKETESIEEEKRKDNKIEREPLVIKPTTPSAPGSGLTSASALGFGGPSDWMHFNDYDATEEVDDLALYTSNKPKTAELPASNMPKEEEANKLEASLSPRQLMAREREVLPTIQERASENLEDVTKASISDQQPPQSDTSSAKDSVSPTENPSASSQEAITAPPVVSQSQASSDTSSAPTSVVIQDGTQRDSSSDNVIVQQEEVVRPPEADKAPRPEPTKARDETTQQQQDNVQQRTSEPSSTRTRVLSNQSSQLNSPIDDDDGKEQIIISLQVPDTPAPDKAEHPKPVEEKPRERQLSVLTNVEPKNLESPDLLKSGRKSVFPQSAEMEDPYAGLDPWAKASLNRYVKMLKEEAAAETDEEKFTIFINFTHKETKNRTVLYNMEDESDMSEHPSKVETIQDKDGNLRPKTSVRSKILPSVPTHDEPVPSIPKQIPIARAETMPIQRIAAQNEDIAKNTETENGKPLQRASERTPPPPQPPATAPAQQTNFAAPGTSDDSFVMVDSPATEEKSQPQIKQIKLKEKQSGQLREKGSGHFKEKLSKESKDKQSNGKSGTSLSSIKKALDLVSRKDKGSQPSNLQTLLTKASEDGKKPSSPVTSVKASTPESENPPSATRSDKQSDKTKRISEGEGRAYEGDKAANRQTIYRPFSGLLRQSSVQQQPGSVDGGSKRSSVFDRRSTAADSGSGKSPNAFDKPFEELKPPPIRPLNYRFTILEPLLIVIPQEGVLHQEPQQLTNLRQAMEPIPDDFSFIHKTVLAWDAEAKKAREKYERERHARQTENENRIDALFNDKEIGYGDISQLEGEFKRQEAAKKADEDREEVGTFVSGVFDVVWARINYEMDQLTPLYEQCVNLVSNASAGRSMFEDTEERVPIAPVMEILLILYQKLMVRHQKAFEAVLERDRRLKKTEVAPWYALGSMEKVKKIEKRFEDAEKKAILEFCRQRDDRANLLMDVLDQNTLRGVGANQDYMESIMQAVRKIATEIALGANGRNEKNGSIGNDDIVSADEVLKAKTITTALARSSEQIVQTFHVADMLLNAADYEVSVANAKLSNADAAAFKRLREAKAKEDNKLAMDLEHRMNLIRGDTQRTQEEIAKLLALIGKKDSSTNIASLVDAEERRPDSGGSIGTPGGADQRSQNVGMEREREGRMQRALEEAKRRNGRKGG